MQLKKCFCLLMGSIISLSCFCVDAGAINASPREAETVISRASGRFSIENIKQLSEKTYAVVQWIPDSGEGRVYLIELGREEIDFIKKEMPLSMGVAVYKEIFSGNTIVFGAVSDKVWKDFDSEPEQVNFTKVEILYSGGKEQETVNNFSGFLFCIPGEKYIDDVLFYSGDEVIAKLSDLPLGENVVENFNR